MSATARAERLSSLAAYGSDIAGWHRLAADVRNEVEAGNLTHPATSARYDAVLLLWLRAEYGGSTNAHLQESLRALCQREAIVTGAETRFEPCPCCGRASLEELGAYEICRVCGWEDDGQDNKDADIAFGGPNGRLSLTQARVDWLAFDESEADDEPAGHFVSPGKHALARRFELSSDKSEIREVGANWTSRAFTWPAEGSELD